MKHIPLLLFLVLTFSGRAQEYKPMLTDFNEWHLTSCHFGCTTDIYYTAGDTVVNGKTHKILDGYHYISRTFLLREDVPSRKVFLTLTNFGNEENLLYDFSMKVGDSIDIKNPITPFPYDGGFYKLDSIVTRPLINQEKHRYFYLSPAASNKVSSHPAVWIEGIGSLSMVTAPGGDPDLGGAGLLSCFFRNGKLIYADYETVDDCTPKILDIPKSYFSEIKLINDRQNNLYYLQNSRNIQELALVDMQGRRIKTIFGNGEEIIPLNIDFLQGGTYILRIHLSSGAYKSFRIVK